MTLPTCAVCYEPIPTPESTALGALGACETHSACRACLTTWLTECVNMRRLPDLPCVAHGSGCKHVLPFRLLQHLVDDPVVQRYLDRSAVVAIAQSGRILSCPLCPCVFVLENTAETEGCTEFQCRCLARVCMLCQRRSHPGKPCTEAELEASEAATQKFFATFTKPCIACAWPIQKNGGCNSMTCSQCKKVFCWMCSKTFETGNDHSACYQQMTQEQASLDRQLSKHGKALTKDKLRLTNVEELLADRLQIGNKGLRKARSRAGARPPQQAGETAPHETTLPQEPVHQ
eukprot:TRINITY_DN3992_c0_g1_i1.p2 TRINITY_DN3992_c0_g1~~TRINITY_DN3992_c0_g1_i1.p2  ORF type:complete len:307 (-),score=40.80 TRINITY_DN3992_c0_g1_i1:21-887(-)